MSTKIIDNNGGGGSTATNSSNAGGIGGSSSGGGGGGGGEGGDDSSKIPAVITTAHLLLRGLIPAFVGCPIGICENTTNGGGGGGGGDGGVRASAFQMTYRKDLPKLGAKNGECKIIIITWSGDPSLPMMCCSLLLLFVKLYIHFTAYILIFACTF
jgi:hypothetical protein